MKNIIIVMLFALAFTTGATAQESNKECETAICCDTDKNHCTDEEKAKCKELGLTCSSTEKASTAETDTKACTLNSACCTGSKKLPKKSKA